MAMTAAGRPRVLQVVLGLSPGGTERIVRQLVERGRAACDMAVCCLDEAGAWGEALARDGVPVWALGRAPGFRPALAWRIRAHARRFNADVLHCHQYSPFVYGRLAGVLARRPVVFTEHGRLSDAPPSARRRRVNRVLTLGAAHLYAVSDELRGFMLDEGYPARVRVVRNGVDMPSPAVSATRDALRAGWDVRPEEFVIGAIARLDPVKDLATLLEAVAAGRATGRPWRLVVAGDGPEAGALRACAQAHGLDRVVLWLGAVPDARTVIPGFDVAVNTSVSEGVSLTILEAMAAGVPVAATAVGGTPEVVQHDVTGMLVPPRTPAALVPVLARLHDDVPLRRRLGDAGAARVRAEFSLDGMVARYVELYRRLAQEAA